VSNAQAPRAPSPRAREAVTRLVDEHGGTLYALGLRFCGDRTDAEDLVQETFAGALRGWDRFEGRSSETTWLYTIASRVCQRMKRRRAGEPEAIGSLDETLPFGEARVAMIPAGGATGLDEQIRREAAERVEAAIASLPDDFRMPVVLRELVGLTVPEIASILGLEEGTVKSRLVHADDLRRAARAVGLPDRLPEDGRGDPVRPSGCRPLPRPRVGERAADRRGRGDAHPRRLRLRGAGGRGALRGAGVCLGRGRARLAVRAGSARTTTAVLQDGDSFDIGNIRFEARHTPGHTPEHMIYIVTDRGSDADEPIGVVSGDFLFVGDLGRPDLLETAAGQTGAMETGARDLFRSIGRSGRSPSSRRSGPGTGRAARAARPSARSP
jgi:RNA polymerase sigma-70 factor (ECF subfamily)